jgi:hypothetical protein
LERLTRGGYALVARTVGAPDGPLPRAASRAGAGRNLLLVHGTFSDVVGGFGALAASRLADGRNAFDALADAYNGRVFGFDHYTISESLEENARALLAALSDRGAEFDVVTHSRGALVLRTLVQGREALGATSGRFGLRRAVLVAAPNAGTPLAAPARWEMLTAWLANLIDLFPDNPFSFGVSFLAEAIGWLARPTIGALPGIAAMTPDGPSVAALRDVPWPGERPAALVSNYEPAIGVAARLADIGTDALFGGANDLVVPTEAGWRVDRANGAEDIGAIGCYGPGGNLTASSGAAVQHCNFFSQRETVEFLHRVLAGQTVELPALDPARPLPWHSAASLTGTAPPLAAGAIRRGDAASETTVARRGALPAAGARRGAVERRGREQAAASNDEVFQLLVVSPSVARSRADSAASVDRDLSRMIRAAERDDTAVIIAAFRNARVVEPFRKRGGIAGSRWREIIDARRAIDRRARGDAKAPAVGDSELARVGCLMFETLFPGQIRRLYDAARSERRERRLEVSFTSMIRWVADKPWELAYDPTREMFLCTQEINFIRNVFTAVPAESIPARTGPLRVLVAAAQPADAGELSAEDELVWIREAFTSRIESRSVEIDVLAGATAAALHARLERATESGTPFDALHFIGHGEFRAKDGMGYLAFESAPGAREASRPAQLIPATTFREIVARRGIRLVFLNACDSGRGFGRADDEFAAGTAPFLIAGGVPAVVANQFPVLDRSAAAFASHLYARLARGQSIGDAMRESRVAIRYLATAEPADWAIPVLFARNPADRLVEPWSDATP